MDNIRNQFPILNRKINDHDLIYFDNAATTQKPQAVLDAIIDYYSNHNANIHRGVHTLAEESTQMWVDAHSTVAEFIGADSFEEIVFIKNATEGLNLVANTFCKQFVGPDDIVVLTDLEHHSNIVPWQLVGVKIEWIPVLPDFSLDVEYMEFLVRKYKEKIKLVSISHVSNVLGHLNEIEEITKLAKSVGAKVLLDASQSITHMQVDVKKLNCDFLVFSSHKFYGPTGIGVLYIRKEIGEELEPWMGGGEMISKVWRTGADWNTLPWKFEAGTQNLVGGIALAESINWFEREVGYNRLEIHEGKLVDVAMEGLNEIKNVSILGKSDSKEHLGLISFRISNMHPHDIASLMDESGIAIRAGYHCAEPLHERYGGDPSARVSFAIYNTVDEVRTFISVLKKIVKQF